MLEDITKLTTMVFDEALDFSKNLMAPMAIYDTYRSLHVVIDNISLVSNHYLALKFDEDYLQNSSFGKPIDKWRWFLNEDLETLNSSIKKYLHSLTLLTFEDSHENILSNYFEEKYYYGFVRNQYSVGYIEPKSTTCTIVALNMQMTSDEYNLSKYKKIELSSYQQRLDLQEVLLKQKKLLELEIKKLEEYIEYKYELKNLLYKKAV